MVPTERACAFDIAPRVPGLLYRLPRQALLDNAMAVIPLGIARTAIDTLMELASAERQAGSVRWSSGRQSRPKLGGRRPSTDRVARSSTIWWLSSGADVQAGREIGVTQLAMLRLARTHAVQAAVQAVDLMYTAVEALSTSTTS